MLHPPERKHMSDQPQQVSPLQQEAITAEQMLTLQATNDYLRQRTVHLNVRVRTLTAEVERLSALIPEDGEPAPDADPTTDPESNDSE